MVINQKCLFRREWPEPLRLGQQTLVQRFLDGFLIEPSTDNDQFGSLVDSWCLPYFHRLIAKTRHVWPMVLPDGFSPKASLMDVVKHPQLATIRLRYRCGLPAT